MKAVDTLVELDRETSLGLLAGLEVGRVAWAEGDRVMVMPLNFVVGAGCVLAVTPSEAIFAAAASHPTLSFQGDEFEPGVHAGWTILVSGPAEEVVDAAEVERTRGLVSTWRQGSGFRVLRIRIDDVTGRRLLLQPGAIKSVYIDDEEGVSLVTDRQGEAKLLELSHDECFALLGTRQVGRLGVVAEHYPLIFPVNYALDHDVIVIRTGRGTKHSYAGHANITFEVDDIDEQTHAGWSVLVKGLAEEITEAHGAERVDRTKAAAPKPWAPGEHGHWMRLIPHYVTGRRLTPGALPDIFEAAAYL